jgi:hypothetical protein
MANSYEVTLHDCGSYCTATLKAASLSRPDEHYFVHNVRRHLALHTLVSTKHRHNSAATENVCATYYRYLVTQHHGSELAQLAVFTQCVVLHRFLQHYCIRS